MRLCLQAEMESLKTAYGTRLATVEEKCGLLESKAAKSEALPEVSTCSLIDAYSHQSSVVSATMARQMPKLRLIH